tara:strand:- start:1099 stop:1974 length:876 start_codon:yes stop_codon:yes gene_type:complete
MIKHSKYKNTGILFELLVRQTASDTLKGVKKSKALNLINKYFGGSTSLGRELVLYQGLVKETFDKDVKAERFINAVIVERSKINNKTIKGEKYNLIREIKNNYDLKSFFNQRIPDYKIQATIYKIFEQESGKRKINPVNSVNNHFTILEHVTRGKVKHEPVKPTELISEYSKQNEELRLLSYKILVDKFNEKYGKSLNESQKMILKKYINNISNTKVLAEFVKSKLPIIENDLASIGKKIGDRVVKIKLTEVVNQLKSFSELKVIKENHLVTLLRYYELIQECKNVINKKV